MRELLEYATWAVPLWVSFKYRLLFFDASPQSALAAVSVAWGAYVIWGTAISQKVQGCEVDWLPGTPLAVLAAALLPILVARNIRPAVGATCALIVASAFARHPDAGTCRTTTAAVGICVAVITLFVQEIDTLKRLAKQAATDPGSDDGEWAARYRL